jgi:hypothetical protein
LNPKEKTSQRKAGTQYPCAAIRRRYR